MIRHRRLHLQPPAGSSHRRGNDSDKQKEFRVEYGFAHWSGNALLDSRIKKNKTPVHPTVGNTDGQKREKKNRKPQRKTHKRDTY